MPSGVANPLASDKAAMQRTSPYPTGAFPVRPNRPFTAQQPATTTAANAPPASAPSNPTRDP